MSTHRPETVAASRATVWGLFHERARINPSAIALSGAEGTVTFRELDNRVLRIAKVLRARGISRGDRIALLSENRFAYLEIELACACLGVVVAAQNWRLSREELRHCIGLADPSLVITSERYLGLFRSTGLEVPAMVIETDYEPAVAEASALPEPPVVDPEDGLIILYTSGTTGLPKGALISHRAEIARSSVYRMDLGIRADDSFVAWSPLFHMGSADASLSCLMSGGTVHVIDGFNPRAIVDIMATTRIGWLVLMPGTIEQIVDLMKAEKTRVHNVHLVGAMLDLVPLELVAELTRLIGAPYVNSFGSTETGLPPFTGSTIAAGQVASRLSKQQSSLIEVRLVDSDGREVADGDPGEAAVRGPTLFSGYWNAPDANKKDFADGWFHMGDMFRRNPDGTVDFVDRAKYLIKSGGENIYPAEIERLLLADPRVRDAAIVRRPDRHWGEVPVAFVAPLLPDLTTEQIEAIFQHKLARYKHPREVRLIDYDDLPRSTTGKILRHELEALLQKDRETIG
jgi:fatty-acyl-CoA synthase